MSPRVLAVCCALAAAACAGRSARVDVGVDFGNNWLLGPVVIAEAEQARIREVALAALREAFQGFAVDFAEDTTRDRIIRLDRHLLRTGWTQIGSKVSLVSLDGVNLTLLTVTGCRSIAGCEAHHRAELIDAMGRGIGATGAHELGHQAGFRFVRDSKCDDCYDGASATHPSHFYGGKHWSPESLAMMRVVLPARAAH